MMRTCLFLLHNKTGLLFVACDYFSYKCEYCEWRKKYIAFNFGAILSDAYLSVKSSHIIQTSLFHNSSYSLSNYHHEKGSEECLRFPVI